MHQIMLMGRLGSDPETRFTSGGLKVTSFRMAVSVRKGGNEETMWWRVTVWGERFDKMMTYLKKGSAVIASGTMQIPDTYEARDGSTRVSLEMTAETLNFSPFGRSQEGEGNQQSSGNYSQGGGASGGSSYGKPAPQQPQAEAAPMAFGMADTSSASGDMSEGDNLPF